MHVLRRVWVIGAAFIMFASVSAHAQAARSFDIPAGPLGAAVARLGQQADVMITADPQLLRGLRTAGLRGEYTPEQALNALLARNDLIAQPDGQGGFIVAAAPATAPRRPAVADEPVSEVTVTGQKMRRTLLDTQSSVGVVTAEDIETKDLTTFREAFKTMANVMGGDWLDSGFVIRGVNSEGLTSGAPLASLYIDGAEQTKMGTRRGSRGLWDVEQVEVYRGPQSTLSGRAALAGAIYISTRDPSYDSDAAARVSFGELNTKEGAVAGGGPIVADKVAFRISAEYQNRDSETSYPTFTQFDRYDTLKEDKYYQVRGKLRFDPLPGLTAVLSHAYSYDSPAYDDVGGPGLGWNYADRRGDFNDPAFQEARESNNHSSAARVVYELSPSISLTSLTTLADSNTDRSSVNAGTAGETFVVTGTEDERLLTQEMRVNYDGAQGLRAVGGVYYNHYRLTSQRTSTLPVSGGRVDDTSLVNRSDNYALFGEVTVPVLPKLSLIAGGRFDHTEAEIDSSFDRSFFNPTLPGITTIDTVADDESEFLPKVGLDYALAPETKVGLVAQRGFRPGGVQRDTNTGVVTSFGAESALTVEASLRHGFSGRGNLSLNIFHTDWKDQQVRFDTRNSDGSLSRITVNAGESRLYGAELEGRFNFRRDLSSFVSLGYLNTRFQSFIAADLGDFTGLAFPQAPEWTASAGIDYRSPSGFFVGTDAKFIGSFISREMQNAPIDEAGDYIVTNVRAGYTFGNFSAMVFADNVFDEQYFLYRDRIDLGLPTGPLDLFGTMGRSRVVGVTAQMRF